jgi:hypothetical protein
MEVSVGTVKSRILRGRRLLREALSPLLHQTQQTKPAPPEAVEKKDNGSAAQGNGFAQSETVMTASIIGGMHPSIGGRR